jgi:hypothetical protein
MVYFFRAGDFVKIGFSKSVEGRLRTIQTGCPLDVSILGFVEGDVRDEQEIQKRFRKHHHRNEWFNATPELLSDILKLLTLKRPQRKPLLPRSRILALAVMADVDPRTIRKILQGKPTIGLAHHRAIKVLTANGIVDSEGKILFTALSA